MRGPLEIRWDFDPPGAEVRLQSGRGDVGMECAPVDLVGRGFAGSDDRHGVSTLVYAIGTYGSTFTVAPLVIPDDPGSTTPSSGDRYD